MQSFNPERAMQQTRREFGEHGGVCPSIERSSTFTVMDPKIMPEIFKGVRGPDAGGYFLYSRHFNPTLQILARYLAAMEGTEFAVCSASGMSAISCTLLQLCRHGDHIVSSNTIYGGSHALLKDVFPSMGITAAMVDPSDTAAFEAAITPKTKVLFTESVANPTLKISDISALAKVAKKHGIVLVVDNTFTPMLVSPSQLGADIVVYSLTKFINGASDIVAGAICCSKDFVNELMDVHTGRTMVLGPTMDSRVAFDVIQRLPHLGIRMKEHSRRALHIAKRLEKLEVPVGYPGLKSHPHHERMTELMNEGFGYGGLLTVDCGTAEKADQLMDILQNEEQFGLIAVSLGYFDTLMSCSGSSTSSEIDPKEQAKMGLSPGLVRFAIGLTGVLEDRMAQLEKGLKAVGLVKEKRVA